MDGCLLPRKKTPSVSGCARIFFSSAKEAARAIAANEMELKGRPVIIREVGGCRVFSVTAVALFIAHTPLCPCTNGWLIR